MIVFKRPFAIFDVDLIGIAGVLVAIALGYSAIAAPWMARLRADVNLAASVARADASTRSAAARLRSMRAGIEELHEGVRIQSAQSPTAAASAAFANELAERALECGLDVEQILPQPAKLANGRLTSDFVVTANGSMVDFIRMLDRARRENTFHRVTDYAIVSSGKGREGRCTITWTVRLHLKSDDQTERPARSARTSDRADPRAQNGDSWVLDREHQRS